MLKDSGSGSLSKSKTHSSSNKRISSKDKRILKQIYFAEESYLTSSTSEGKINGDVKRRCKQIIKAIYLDEPETLRSYIDSGRRPLHIKEIQRRILEAIELNSLECLKVLCETYEMRPISRKKNADIELFYQWYGLASWPLNERPKETALHVLPSKSNSEKAMKVLDECGSKFVTDFLDVEDSHGSTPLLRAIKCNNIAVVKWLLRKKPNVNNINKRNVHDESPIYVAALNDHVNVIKEILETYSKPEELRSNLLEIMKNIDGELNINGHSILYPASLSGKSEVLNLIMKEKLWEDFLKQEKQFKTIDRNKWQEFFCNVCAAGCKDLAKIILLDDPDLVRGSNGEMSPLMRAVEANQQEIVQLFFDNIQDEDFLNVIKSCDKLNRNVFHYAVKNSKVLKDLLDKFRELSKDYEEDYGAINGMDNDDNTPIKLAALENLEESFEMLLNYATSEEDLFSANLIHTLKSKVLKKRLRSWKENDADAVATLLNGEHEKHQPFLEAAKAGNEDLIKFFLEQNANPLQVTHDRGETALHLVVLSGNLNVLKYLLKKKEFLEMINSTDEENISCAGYATQIGHAEILRFLHKKGAKMKSDKKTGRLNILDSAYGYFKWCENSIEELIAICTPQELKELFEDSYFGADHIMSKLIEEIPNVAKKIFDQCIYKKLEFTYSHRSPGEIKARKRVLYNFYPFKRKKRDGKLEAIKSMVDFKRDSLLDHSLVVQFLNQKMNSPSIRKWFILNFLLYVMFLLTLTTYGVIQRHDVHNLKSPEMIVLSFFILTICAFHFIKEILQIVINQTNYMHDFENYIEWVMYTCAVIYVVPVGNTKADAQIACGATALFLGWINFSLFLKRFSLLGIYIIAAKRVFLTVCKVLPLVLLFVLAFSLSLSLLMPLDEGFNNMPISLLTTFVMMTGELDYRDTFLASGPLHFLQKILLVLFILMISITIMNLLTGLAVGDANEIMERSKEEKRIHKAKLVMTMESSLHNFFLIPRPNEIDDCEVDSLADEEMQPSWWLRQWKKFYDDEVDEPAVKPMANEEKNDYGKQFDELSEKIEKTNELVKQMLEKIPPGGKGRRRNLAV
ncbi:transient receptor potential cation channel subfamily A member 1-like [Paramuricea clavata]|uniref:Transient receptor potential cation channel subfamily A member 1-like n=1 Tax=Paramuricea clavata TaxID=317549 RepID=A0A6S7GCL1_PARCT|nr:transient receptor potential cation channel subfamily A member 1-like [Paramuricea clavata]